MGEERGSGPLGARRGESPHRHPQADSVHYAEPLKDRNRLEQKTHGVQGNAPSTRGKNFVRYSAIENAA